MAEEIIIRAQQRSWLEHSILQGYVTAYSDHLHRGRYAPNTRRVYLCCVAHFAHWLTTEHHPLSAVSEAAVRQFVAEHLPRCDCPYPVRRIPHEIRAALAQLLDVLRAEGAIASDAAPETHLARELARFDAHMRDVGGLALNTRQQRCGIVARFLAGLFQTGPILIPAIEPTAIRHFVLGNGAEWSAGTISVIGGAIGGYLRFRLAHGSDGDTAWTDGVVGSDPAGRALAPRIIAGSPLRCRDRRSAWVIRSAVPVASACLRDGAVPHRSRPEMQRSRQSSP